MNDVTKTVNSCQYMILLTVHKKAIYFINKIKHMFAVITR